MNSAAKRRNDSAEKYGQRINKDAAFVQAAKLLWTPVAIEQVQELANTIMKDSNARAGQ